MIKKFIQYIFFVSILSVTVLSCTKEISDDIFNFIESFFSLTVTSDTKEVEIEEVVNFTLNLQESDLPSEYILDFSSSGEGEFTLNSRSFTSGQSTNIETGTRNITYLPTSNGVHLVKFTVTNANEDPLSLSETINITVGEPEESEPSFNITVGTDLENVNEEGIPTVAEGATVTITIRIINELDNVPDGTEYAIDFGSSATGTFVFEGENYTGDSRVVVTEKELVFEFTPEEIEEYDLKFSVTSQFDDSSICESAIFDVLTSDSQTPVITLNGENPLTLTVGDVYVEEATVVDDIDNAITITFGGTFDGTTNTVGEFIRTYNAIDSDGNVAEQKERIINVVAQDVVLIESITLTPEILNLGLNTTQELNVVISPENATNTELEWTSGDTSIATVANGIITTVGLGGPINITARATDGSSSSTIVELTVISNIILANEITIVNSSEIMQVGESDTFTVSVTPAEASQTVMWTSTNPNVASVNENTGLVTALTAGETMITAETTDGSNLEVSTNVTVEIAVTGISVTPSEVTLIVGGIVDLEASVQPSNVINQVVIWTSNNPEIVEVDSNGRIAGVSVGNTVVRATIGGFSSIVSVIVSASNSSPTANISFTPASGGVTGTEYTFDGSGSSDPQGDSLTYTWLIDGSEITGAEVMYTFTTAGTFTIELTVSDGELESTIEETITIVDANEAPNAEFTVSSTSGTTETVFIFDSSGTSDSNNDVLSYSWSDGTTVFSDLVNPTHIFPEAGIYTVTLTVNDGNGGVDTFTEIINVTEALSGENDIVSFTLNGEDIDASIDFENHNATIQLDSGTASEAFSDLDVMISGGAGLQLLTSVGFVDNNGRVYVYIVTAANGEEQEWAVSIFDEPLSNENDIVGITVDGQTVDVDIDFDNHRVTIQLDSGTGSEAFSELNVIVSEGAESASTGAGLIENGLGVGYSVVAENGEVQQWALFILDAIVPVATIAIDPARDDFDVGLIKQFTVEIQPMNATNQSVSWETSDPTIATVNSNGLVTTISPGDVNITVISDADPSIRSTASILVEDPNIPVTGVSIELTLTTVEVGSSRILSNTISPSNATNQNVIWSSSNSNVVSVSSIGVIRGVSTSLRPITITVTTADGGFADEVSITVISSDDDDGEDCSEQEETFCETLGGTWVGGANCTCIPCGSNGQVCP